MGSHGPMVPLDPSLTKKHRNLRTGKAEVWEAVSKDGRWLFEREESEGTPWLIWRRDPDTGKPEPGPSGGPSLICSSLPRARRYVASGAVERNERLTRANMARRAS